MTRLRAVLALGVLAPAAVLKACGIPASRIRFRHGAIHELPDGLILADSYHVSRYNTNTGRLTTEMFEAVMFALGQRLAAAGEARWLVAQVAVLVAVALAHTLATELRVQQILAVAAVAQATRLALVAQAVLVSLFFATSVLSAAQAAS
jgi:hypothetical protein